MKKIVKITVILLIATFIVSQIISKISLAKTSSPEYIVLKNLGIIEIRQYPAMVIASTNMKGKRYSENSGNGFRTLASYIFGSNETGEKISMTSPVMVEMSDTMKMSFIMPEEYQMVDLPQPEAQNVFLHESKPKVFAVIRYGGFNNDKKFEKYKKRFLEILKENSLITKGSFLFFGYNPPYDLINRRNEVVVEINWE
jgi:hypothetical protein